MGSYHYPRDYGYGVELSGFGGAYLSTASAVAGILMFLAFLTLGLVAGFCYLVDLVEEHTQLTKKIINVVVKFIMALYVVLLLVDGLPFLCIFFGVAAHVVYHRLLRQFPNLDLISYEFLGSCGLFFISTFMWTHFLWLDPRCAYVSLEWAFGFMVIMTFLVPFFFCIALTISETLPFADPSGSSKHTGKSRRSFLSVFRLKREQDLPTVAAEQTYPMHTYRRQV